MKIKILTAITALSALGFAATGAYAQAPAAPSAAPSELVYLPQLPSPASLISAAKASGVAVVKIDQTSSQVIAVYQDAKGQINTVSYQVIPAAEAAGGATVPAPSTPAPAPTTTVVYQTAPGYYGPYYGGYYPWGWYAPVSVRLGFGYRGGRW